MEEYLQELQNNAAKLLAERFGRRATAEVSPILELVTELLEDGAGGVKEIPTLTTDEWLRWNRLLLENPRRLQEAADSLLLEEEFPLPSAEPPLLHWAAWLLVSTLDRL